MAGRNFPLGFHSDVDYWYDSIISRSQRPGNSTLITFYLDFWLQHLGCGNLAHLIFRTRAMNKGEPVIGSPLFAHGNIETWKVYAGYAPDQLTQLQSLRR
jgi:hypothetical protein